jgi:hypothetical protein
MPGVTRHALTLQECADELSVSVGIIRRQIATGALSALVLSPNGNPRKPGPKLFRVERAEWERFKRSIRTQAETPAVERPEMPRRRGRPKKGAEKPTGRMSGYR